MITGKTQIYGILADPIYQVRTPQLLNEYFKKYHHDGVMVPFHVKKEYFLNLWEELKYVENYKGMVITVPHKVSAKELCDELTESAQIIGSVNIVRKTKMGRFIGDNSDGAGFINGLTANGYSLINKKVLLIGAGGAGIAIAYHLALSGISSLTILNRNKNKAENIVEKLHKKFPNLNFNNHLSGDYDLIINSTSLGMNENDELPIDAKFINPGVTVAEVVMKPHITPLLELAQKKGCKIHHGIHMLEGQIKKMFDFLTE